MLDVVLLGLICWALFALTEYQLELSRTWAAWLAMFGGAALFSLVSSHWKARRLRLQLQPRVNDPAAIDETVHLLGQAELPQGCLVLISMCTSGAAAWMLLYLYLPWEPDSTFGHICRHIVVLIGALVIDLCFVLIQGQLLLPDKLLQSAGATQAFSQQVLARKQQPATPQVGLPRTLFKPTAAPTTPAAPPAAAPPVARPSPPAAAAPAPRPAPSPPAPHLGWGAKTHDVFISYSSKDIEVAELICQSLEARGVRCWIAPRDMPAGVHWSEALIDALSSARVLLLVFSSNSNRSPQVTREVERAVAKGIPILPLRIEDEKLSKSMEYFISASHWLDALTRPLDGHLTQLAQAVNRLLARMNDEDITGHQAVTEVVRLTTGGPAVPSFSRSPRRQDVNLILLDALCCVMSVDGIASPAEKATIRGLMAKIQAPLSKDEINRHMDEFQDRVAREGFAEVVDAVASEAVIFKQKGQADLLISSLRAVAKAEFRVHSSEEVMIERFQTIVG